MYPYLAGKLNFVHSAFSFGMLAREPWPEGSCLLAIPFDLLSPILRNLKEMDWVVPAYRVGRDGWVSLFKQELDELTEETGTSGSREA